MHIVKEGEAPPPATYYFTCLACKGQWELDHHEMPEAGEHIRCPTSGCRGSMPAPHPSVVEGIEVTVRHSVSPEHPESG